MSTEPNMKVKLKKSKENLSPEKELLVEKEPELTQAQKDEMVMSCFSPKDKGRLQHFLTNGTPGVLAVDEYNLSRALEYYLEGNNFDYISNRCQIKRDVVLFYAFKQNWFSKKNDRVSKLAETLIERYQVAKIDSASFLMELIQFWHDFYRAKLNQYRITKDDRIVETLDLKHLEKYFKTVELLEKMASRPKADAPPMEHLFLKPIPSDNGSVDTKPAGAPTPISHQENSSLLEMLTELRRAKDNMTGVKSE